MSVWTLYEVFVRSKHGLNHKHVAACMLPTPPWPSRMPVSCTPVAAKA